MKIRYLISFLVLIILINGCVYQTQTEKPKDFDSNTLSLLCEKSFYPKTCLALVKEDPNMCKNAEEVNLCYEQLALITKNTELCNKIELEAEHTIEIEDYLRYCKALVLKRKNDLSVCETTHDPSQCYRDMAVKLNDPTICEKIIRIKQKQRCLAVVNVDLKLCNNADDPETCLNEVYKRLSITKKDLSYCDKLKIKEGDRESWGCYWDVAVAFGDPSICEISKMSSLCYGYVATKLGRFDLCDESNEIGSKVWKRCYFDVIVAMKKSTS